MRLIVTHEYPDLDAIASLALARLLYPASYTTLQGTISPNVKEVMALYRDELRHINLDQINPDDVTELIVVDTADARRIKPFDQVLERITAVVYDHHPVPTYPIASHRGITEPVGACATLLVRELRQLNIEIPPPIASLALLGIHSDTGNFTFDLTHQADHDAAAYLLKQGADLQLVRRLGAQPLTESQQAFARNVERHMERHEINGKHVVVAGFTHGAYVTDAAVVVANLRTSYAADAIAVAVRMEDDKTFIIGRSNTHFDSAAALSEVSDAGGHQGASFGITLDPPESLPEKLVAAFKKHATPELRALDIMTTPVRTITADTTIRVASNMLDTASHNGLPVTDSDGVLVGIISRRDLDRATRHGMGEKTVSAVMAREIVTATPDVTLPELEKLVVQHNVGRLPIIANGALVGIVTRSDLLSAHHTRHTESEADALLARLPSVPREFLNIARRHVNVHAGAGLYLVGGVVRDVLLGRSSLDIDLVSVGEDAQVLAKRIVQETGGEVIEHDTFGTCTIVLPSGLDIDIATARSEHYLHPGSMPEVRRGSIRQDLSRRDFTMNAMAIRISPAPVEIIDPFNGREDLQKGMLRTLHPLSFIEDPTRILRGVRLKARLSFSFGVAAMRQLREAAVPEYISKVSSQRLRNELELMLHEPSASRTLKELYELDLMEPFYSLTLTQPDVVWATLARLDSFRKTRDIPPEAHLYALWFGTRADHTATVPAGLQRHLERFDWPLKLRSEFVRVLEYMEQAPERLILDEEFAALSPAALEFIRAEHGVLAEQLAALEQRPPRRTVRGQDLLDLGVPSGPELGALLKRIAEERTAGRVASFDEELAFAQRLLERDDAGKVN